MNRRYKIGNIDGKSNYHTHSLYCDGKNTPEEMIERAMELGFNSLGFSGHQFSVQDADYAMDTIKELGYREHINRLKKEYKGKIDIYLGIERDSLSSVTSGFDYVIGSTHHIPFEGDYIHVDYSPSMVDDSVRKYFQGDYMAYIEAYYQYEKNVLERTKGQIVGHFDLVSVFNGGDKFFNEKDPAYKRAAIKSCEGILEGFTEKKGRRELPKDFPEELAMLIDATGLPIFEINTGATAKGRRDVPYPAPFIIEYLADQGVPFVMNSDCHDRRYLDFGFGPLINRYNE